MTVITWPSDFNVASGSMRVQAITQTSTSPFSGASKAALSGALWVADVSFPPMDHSRARQFQALVDGLDGPVNPVLIPAWFASRPVLYGALTGDQPWSDDSFWSDGSGWSTHGWSLMVAADAPAGSLSVRLSGFPAGQEVLRPGDILGVAGRLLQVHSSVTADGAGEAVVEFRPALREGVVRFDPVVTDGPTLLARLAPDASGAVVRNPGYADGVSLRFVEAVDIS